MFPTKSTEKVEFRSFRRSQLLHTQAWKSPRHGHRYPSKRKERLRDMKIWGREDPPIFLPFVAKRNGPSRRASISFGITAGIRTDFRYILNSSVNAKSPLVARLVPSRPVPSSSHLASQIRSLRRFAAPNKRTKGSPPRFGNPRSNARPIKSYKRWAAVYERSSYELRQPRAVS